MGGENAGDGGPDVLRGGRRVQTGAREPGSGRSSRPPPTGRGDLRRRRRGHGHRRRRRAPDIASSPELRECPDLAGIKVPSTDVVAVRLFLDKPVRLPNGAMSSPGSRSAATALS